MFGATVLGAAGSAPTAYQIANSLRFDGVDDYLSRTFGTPTDGKKCTFSCWTKRYGTSQTIIGDYAGDANNFSMVYFDANSKLIVNGANSGSTIVDATTTAVFRDPTAWYHIVWVFDSANATGADRVQIWVNGVRQSVTGGTTTLNSTLRMNSAVTVNIGRVPSAINYLSGYLSDIYFIDGQALTPSSFAETNSDGVWVPKAYTGSYGNNGFHLDFSDGTSTTTLGYDAAGSNDWTLTGMTRAAGVNECWMTDSPTCNFATLNPLDWYASGTWAIVDGNLKGSLSSSPANQQGVLGSMLVESAKVYMEFTPIYSGGASTAMGVLDASYQWTGQGNLQAFTRTVAWGLCFSNGNKYNNSSVAYGSAITSSTGILMCAVDTVSGKIWWGKDGTWFASGDPAAGTNAAFTNLPTKVKVYVECGLSGESVTANFGQRAFSYTPPTGFKALCTANLPAVSITNPKAHFDIDLWTGTGAAKSQANWAFKPGFLWGKIRSGADYHVLSNDVVGVDKFLKSNTTDSETTNAQTITSFDASGFSLGTSTDLNRSTYTFVGWGWKAGGTPTTDNVAGAGNVPTAGSVKIDGVNMSSALAGTIAATRLSANTTAGFSIVTYTGTGANATVAHGLGVAPKMVIVRTRGITNNWRVWHTALAGTEEIYLNLTNAKGTDATSWNSTTPTSTVINLGSSGATNASSGSMVAYCFAEIPGYSKFDSYVGNGSADGPFVHCGFRPRYVLIKYSSGAGGDWEIIDAARDTYNVGKAMLLADSANAETTAVGDRLDILANGFKIKNAGGTNLNVNTGTYIYAAFAEYPFGGSNVSPSPAR